MIIQWVLVLALLGTAAYALMQARTPAAVRWANVLASVAGILFVLRPELTNRIAAVLGVGRGADLLLYCWVVVSLALFAQLQLALLRTNEQLTELTRAIALATAQPPPAHDEAPPEEAKRIPG
jgi:hypothetical protein